MAVEIFSRTFNNADKDMQRILIRTYREQLAAAGIRFIKLDENQFVDLIGEREVGVTGRNFLKATGKEKAKATLARQEQKK